jgi:2-polyprenyl-6-methoxyphenol hydroxylase-like FAD-dependent oxidoreductase
VLHRAALLSVLAAAVPPAAVRLGTAATLVDPAAGLVAVDGTEPEAYDLVVAADGLRSAARKVIFPASPEPVYAGVTSWRIVVSVPSAGVLAGETWGRGKIFGMATLADGRIYCYATAVAPPDGRIPDEKAQLRTLFAGWHEPIPSLIEAADTVLRTDIRCLPSLPPRFHSGRTVLLGDAAHAMTPNLGQGGCQAIEDAVVLAYEVGRAPVARALPAYSAARRDRTASVAARSRRIADLTRIVNPAAVALRDGGMWLAGRLGPNLVMRQMDDVMTWRPPTP